MDLTSQYRSFFDQPTLRILTQLYRFGINVHRADKWQELVSYLRWEIRHRFRLFPRRQYLRFTSQQPLVLNDKSRVPTAFAVGPSSQARQGTLPWFMLLTGTGSTCWGCLFSDETGLYVSTDSGQSATLRYRFPWPVQSLFQSTTGVLYVCSQGTVYRSADQGVTFGSVLALNSPNSYFLFNNGMTELPDGRLLLGEYGVAPQGQGWKNIAFLHYSTDEGVTWQTADFLIRDGVNKHVHLTKYSAALNATVLTDGDNKKQVWVNHSLSRLDQPADPHGYGWQRLNQSHYQTGGYLSMTDVDQTVLLGSDYLGGTNFIFSTIDGRRFAPQIVPDPYRRSPVMNLVTRQTATGQLEAWAVLYSTINQATRSLLMYSADAGQTWTKVIDFDGTRHVVRLVSSSAKHVEHLYIAVSTRQANDFTHAVYAVHAT